LNCQKKPKKGAAAADAAEALVADFIRLENIIFQTANTSTHGGGFGPQWIFLCSGIKLSNERPVRAKACNNALSVISPAYACFFFKTNDPPERTARGRKGGKGKGP
jgi:hypothetical protein